MKLGQIRNGGGSVVAAIFEDSTVRPIPGHDLLALIHRAAAEGTSLSELANRQASKPLESFQTTAPIHPPEVWGCGCTYEASSSFRDAEHGTREGMYAFVYRQERPEIFFKGTARVCVGGGEPIGVRSDSHFTAPEPELAVVVGANKEILAYTLANDVSAWDIERENALYLPQSKVFDGCCALGPVLVTADSVSDPYQIDIDCTVTRQGRTLFSGSTSTARLQRKLETLVEFLTRANSIPTGTVMLTGTGIIVTQEAALAPGDVVSIRAEPIGELSNPAVRVG
jgi:2-dehydro-3-deoxy-D-arabinonate dehydratase